MGEHYQTLIGHVLGGIGQSGCYEGYGGTLGYNQGDSAGLHPTTSTTATSTLTATGEARYPLWRSGVCEGASGFTHFKKCQE